MGEKKLIAYVERACRKCGFVFDLLNCPECSKERSRAYYKNNKARLRKAQSEYYAANKERSQVRSKERYASNRGVFLKYAMARYAKLKPVILQQARDKYAANPEPAKKNARKWRAENPGRHQTLLREWGERNQEYRKVYSALWQKNNPDKVRVHNQNRRARKIKAGGRLTPGLSKRLFALQRGLCACCCMPLGNDFHLDHIMPLALGGPNTDQNIQLLRAKCNRMKKAMHPVDYMQMRGKLL